MTGIKKLLIFGAGFIAGSYWMYIKVYTYLVEVAIDAKEE